MVAVSSEIDLVMRVRTVGTLGLVFPPTAQLLLNWALTAPTKRQSLSFAVPALPPTLNHLYKNGPRSKTKLTPEAHRFRRLVQDALGNFRWKGKPGQLMGLYFYCSPHWITKRRTIRQMDGDNRAKALHDSIQLATGLNDSRVWEYHSYKIPSPREQTLVYVVDLGDIVDWYK